MGTFLAILYEWGFERRKESMLVRARLKYPFLVLGTALTVLAVGLSSCSVKVDPEPSCNFVMSAKQQRVSWGSQLPVRLYVDVSVPREYHKAIGRAVQRWNKERELLKVEVWESDGPKDPKRDGFSVIYWRDQWEGDRSREQARTTVYWSGSQIFEADVRINAQNYVFSYSTPPEVFAVDLESVLVHEFGHVLGLAHKDGVQSVMNTELSNGANRRKVYKGDFDDLNCEYL